MTNSVEMTKIQDRVQKLLNMAKDASSPNEAMIAMERARRLMDKYQIEETDLEQVEENRFGAANLFGKQYKFMPVWMNIMATALCKLNGVVGGVIYGDIGIMGLEEDVMLTKMMFDRLAQECINQCKIDQEARGFGKRYNAKVGDAFKKGFPKAFLGALNFAAGAGSRDVAGGANTLCCLPLPPPQGLPIAASRHQAALDVDHEPVERVGKHGGADECKP